MKPGIGRSLIGLCPYSHLWRAVRRMVAERRLPDSARPGASVALLGLFCPFFWIALLSGASGSELMFHAAHSAIVFGIGIALVLAGALKDSRGDDRSREDANCRSSGTGLESGEKRPRETLARETPARETFDG